jgi:hypothetical protein
MWLGIYALMISNTVQATATPESRVSDKEGHALLPGIRHTSEQYTRTFGTNESPTPHIAAVMSEALTETLQ